MPINTFISLKRASSRDAFFRLTVLKRLGLATVLIAVVMAVLATIELTQLARISERETQRDLRNLTRAFAEEVNATVSAIDLSLIHLRTAWQGDPRQFAYRLAKLGHDLDNQVIFQVSITDAAGTLVYSSAKASPVPISLADREHVRVHLNGDGTDTLYISKPVLGRVSGAWSVQFSRRIADASGKVAGVIVASVSPAYFSRFYPTIDLGHGSSIALLRGDGTVITRTTQRGANLDMGKTVAALDFGGFSNEGGFKRASVLDGINRYYAWR